MARLALSFLVITMLIVSPYAAAPVSALTTNTCNNLLATIVGTSGDDLLVGTSGNDVIAGLGGNDQILGLDGNDVICGDGGHDRIDGGTGDDTIFGGNGNDLLLGGDGIDHLEGAGDNDILLGGLDNDTLYGGSGDDLLDGEDGNDILDGEGGDDQLDSTGTGADQLMGGAGTDELQISSSALVDDTCDGGVGSDRLTIGSVCLTQTSIGATGVSVQRLVGKAVLNGETSYIRRLVATNETFFMVKVTGLVPYSSYAWNVKLAPALACAEPGTAALGLKAPYPNLVADRTGQAFLAVTLPGTLSVSSLATLGFTLRVYPTTLPLGAHLYCGTVDNQPWPSNTSHWW